MAKEAEFSKWFRNSMQPEFDFIRVETREEDGFPDLLGKRALDNSPIFVELKSHKVTRNNTVSLELAADQKIRLQWLSNFIVTCVVCELSTSEVLYISIGRPMAWNRLLSGATRVIDILEFDERNKIVPKSQLKNFLLNIPHIN